MATKNELALLISRGDEQAFSKVYFSLLPKLRPFVLKFTRSEADTQEIIQETFTNIWLHREKLAAVDQIEAWVFRVASNCCYNYLRKQVITEKASAVLLHRATPYCDNTAEKIQYNELTSLIDDIVEKFPERRKDIYIMSRVQGMSIPEIADTLGISPNTVKNTLVHSLKQIKESLKHHGFCIGGLVLLASAWYIFN